MIYNFFFFDNTDTLREPFKISIWNKITDFYKSQLQNPLITIVAILFRDIITLILEIIVGCMVVYRYKRFNETLPSNNLNMTLMPRNQIEQVNNIRQNQTNKTRKRLLLMTICISFVSITTHLIVFANVFNNNNNRNTLAQGYPTIYFVVLWFANSTLMIKCLTNFFVFVVFNLNFRKKLIEIFTRSHLN